LKRGPLSVCTGIGKLDSLKRFKDDVREVASGFECGFVIEGFGQKVEEGDILEFFEVVEVKRD
jgi:translation initiation factor IF-2